MIGAVSTLRGLIHTYTFAASNTQETFMPFLMKLKEKCQDHQAVVVMDNLSVHKTKVVQGLFND